MTPAAPVEVKRCPESAELRVTWDDGTVTTLSYGVLRDRCRCAGCRSGLQATNGASVTVREVALFGRYALRFFFDDGHDTGIYPFDYLRRLGRAHAGD